MPTEDNKAVVRQVYEECFNKHHLAAIDTSIDPNEVDHFAPPGTPSGIEGARKLIGMFLTAFPDIHVTVEDMIAEVDKTVARITMSGTQQGAFLGIPPTGKHFSITLIEINRFEGGKSVEHWAEMNLLSLLQQLGVIPALSGLLFLAGLAAGMGLLVLLRKVLT